MSAVQMQHDKGDWCSYSYEKAGMNLFWPVLVAGVARGWRAACTHPLQVAFPQICSNITSPRLQTASW
jgi:hypothetical protein